MAKSYRDEWVDEIGEGSTPTPQKTLAQRVAHANLDLMQCLGKHATTPDPLTTALAMEELASLAIECGSGAEGIEWLTLAVRYREVYERQADRGERISTAYRHEMGQRYGRPL